MGIRNKETERLLEELPEEQRVQLRLGDIYPASLAPVLTAEETLAARWGFSRMGRKGLLVNARGETVTEKPSFKKSFLERRCLIPADGFYEWDAAKKKYYFTRKDGNLIFLCGFYRIEDGEHRFIVLTKNATPPVAKHHNRIPVIAEDAVKYKYLTDMYFASDYIGKDNRICLACTKQ